MAIEGRQLVFLGHGQAVRRAIFNAVATEDAHPEIDGVVAELLFLGGFVHHPIDHGKVDRADADTDLAGDALIKFVVDAAAVALRRDQLLVGVLNCDRSAAEVIEGDAQALGDVAGRVDRILGVFADFLEEPEHDGEVGRADRQRRTMMARIRQRVGELGQPPKASGKTSFRAAVTKRLTKAIGSKNFQPKSRSWSIRTRGTVQRSRMAKKTSR
jgi:hypothetical protein